MRNCRTQSYKMVEVNTEIEAEVDYDSEDFENYLDNAYEEAGFELLNDLVESERISFQDIDKFMKSVGYSVSDQTPKEEPKEHQCCGGMQHNQPGPVNSQSPQYTVLDPTNPEHLEAIIKAITKQLIG